MVRFANAGTRLRATTLCGQRPTGTLTEVLLDDSAPNTGGPGDSLGRLKALLGLGFGRGIWDFPLLFEKVLPRITAERRDFDLALRVAIPDEDRVAALDASPLWRDTAPSDPYSLAQPTE
ncbi:MAG: hypothetical protein KDH15_11665 [Rhodocyclaceae bacterium]|nr:hypothetical protein [Rhodocyclaceae bacterium]